MKSERRKRMYNATQEEIKEAAWEQIAQDGAAALSLRGIATQLGLTSPALYHYFPSRDALVNELVVDAFLSLAVTLETARDVLSPDKHIDRLLAVGAAYREWAHTYPQRYVLIFDAPIPNYRPSLETIQPAADRALSVLVHVVGQAWQASQLRLPAYYQDLSPTLSTQLEDWRQKAGLVYPVQVLYLAIIVWSRIHGIVSLELRQQFPPIADPDEIFQIESTALIQQIGMTGAGFG